MLKLLFALIAGALLALAFAPIGVFSFAYFAPAILLYVWLRSTPGQSFWQGLIFGFGFFGVGTSWIYISIHNFGNANAWLAGLITFLFLLILALYPATQGYVLRKFFGKNKTAICLGAFPATWVLWEFLRSWLFSGFPWLFLGYSQMPTPLKGLAPLFGVYGVSLAVAMIAGCLALLAQYTSRWIKLGCVFIILFWLGLGWWYSDREWTQATTEKPISVAIVQGNIPQTLKWNPDKLRNILKIYWQLTQPNLKAQLIVWPEAAIPAFPSQLTPFIQRLQQQISKHKTYLITGAPIKGNQENEYYNGLLVFGKNQQHYYKRHLVPFGEYVPLAFLFKNVMGYFNIPMSSFTSGPADQAKLKLGNLTIAPFICYEIAFPLEVIQSVLGTNVIVTISDDSWFGRSFALGQHLQMAQLQALSTGRPALLSTNTGISAVISDQGEISQKAPIDKRVVLQALITPRTGKTPLMRWNYYPVLVIVIFLLFSAWRRRNKGGNIE